MIRRLKQWLLSLAARALSASSQQKRIDHREVVKAKASDMRKAMGLPPLAILNTKGN